MTSAALLPREARGLSRAGGQGCTRWADPLGPRGLSSFLYGIHKLDGDGADTFQALPKLILLHC